MGSKIWKLYSFYKSQPKALKFKLFLNFLPHKTTFGIFEILSFWILTIFFENFKFTIVPKSVKKDYFYTLWLYPTEKPKPQLSEKWEIVEQNGVKFGTQEQFRLYMCNFWNFGQLPSVMPKYGNFENWPISLKPLPVEQK